MRGYSSIGGNTGSDNTYFFLKNQFSLNIEDFDPEPRANESQMPKVYGNKFDTLRNMRLQSKKKSSFFSKFFFDLTAKTVHPI